MSESQYYIFGKGEAAIHCIETLLGKVKKENIYVIPELPEPTWTDSLIDYCNQSKIQIYDYSELVVSNINSIGISIYYSKIFNEETINKFKHFVNLHNGPLPKYRGVNPINWALKNGEITHGVTLHFVETGIDTGDIVDQVIFPINEDMEVLDVYNLCIQYGRELLERTIFNLDNITPKEQDEKNATYYSKSDFAKLGDRKYFTRSTNEPHK